MARRHKESSSNPWAGFSFIRADKLLTLRALPRSQDCCDALVDGQDVEFPVLVSHRWTTPDHPDPDGHQLQALQTLVTSVADNALALFASPEEQLAAASSLAVHGVLQAAILASRFVCCHTVPNDRGHLLRRLGVWYDYACMPQKPRTEAEERHFRTCLRNLPVLFSSASVVSLRENAQDDYMSRGWCLAEIASGDQSNYMPLSLFVDLLGREIPPAKLDAAIFAGGENPFNPWVGPAANRARSFLRSWGVAPLPSGKETECTTAVAGDACTRELCTAQQVDRCQLTDCCIHENFGVWCAHSLCSARARVGLRAEESEAEEDEEENYDVEEGEEKEDADGRTADEEEADEEEPEQGTEEEADGGRPTAAAATDDGTELVGSLYQPGFELSVEISNAVSLCELEPPFDLGDVLKDHLADKQIYCTNGGDVLRVGAWLLQSASCEETLCAQFFSIFHERVLAGKSVRVIGVHVDEDENCEEVLVARYDEDEDCEEEDLVARRYDEDEDCEELLVART